MKSRTKILFVLLASTFFLFFQNIHEPIVNRHIVHTDTLT